MKGVVYCITSNNNIYIGSTNRTLNKRLSNHKVFDLYDMDKFNYEIKIIEEVEYNNIKELRKREQFHIDNNECVNMKRAYGSADDKDYQSNYYRLHKDKLLKASSKYQQGDKSKNYRKEYYKKNKDTIHINRKDYYKKNKDTIHINRKDKRNYRISWGGDYRCNNNLLLIDVNLFTD